MSKIVIGHVKRTDPVKTVAEYLNVINTWIKANVKENKQSLSRVWYRGMGAVRKENDSCQPGVYRTGPGSFVERAKSWYGNTDDLKLLNLERHMLQEFRSMAAAFVDPNDYVAVYLTAQHYGMPTRLLDWTANPLAGLFFATERGQGPAEVIVMDAFGLLPERSQEETDKPRDIVGIRHPFTKRAIGQVFWEDVPKNVPKIIFPMRPDTLPGRLGQQSSCFTIHMYDAKDVKNPTMLRVPVDGSKRADLREELRRLNITPFTIYGDMDHLSRHIKDAWEVDFRKDT